MDVARLVLEYVKALAWPVVVVIAVTAFRRQIAAKIGDLKEASSLGSKVSFFDRKARALDEEAATAAQRQEVKNEEAAIDEADADTGRPDATEGAPSPESPTEPPTEPTPDAEPKTPTGEATADAATLQAQRRKLEAIERRLERERTFRALSEAAADVFSPPDFDQARETVATSPPAAVMLAYSYLEKVTRAAYVVQQMAPPTNRLASNVPRMIEELTKTGLASEFVPLVSGLAELRHRLAHGVAGTTVTEAGAFDYVQACERISDALAGTARSKLRHPSRAALVAGWQAWADRRRPASGDDDLTEAREDAPGSA
jgi:hypothetical protein